MSIKDFINGKVTYDKFGGQYFWIAQPGGGSQMLAELRGWGHIQNMFAKKDGIIDASAAAKYQDEIGDFVAAAINEKIERQNAANKKTGSEIINKAIIRAKKIDRDKYNAVSFRFGYIAGYEDAQGDAGER